MFPRNLIKSKIAEIVDRDFGPSPNKAKRLEELEDPNIKHVTISLPYTDFRCSKVASQIHKLLEKYTPNFKLRIAFSTIKLASVILPRLKPKINYTHSSNIVYQFNCPCNSVYIGETTKLLELRVFQHRTDAKSTVGPHILTCPAYINSLESTYGNQPSDCQRRTHLLTFFKVVETNLHNSNARKTFEGLMITLEKPDLNKQVLHRSTALVCKCILPTEISLTPGVNSAILGPGVPRLLN